MTYRTPEQRAEWAAWMREYNKRPEVREKALARKARYRERNRALLAQKESERYYANHQQELDKRKILRQDPVYKAKHYELAKEWALRNPDKVKASQLKFQQSDQGRYSRSDQKAKRRIREKQNRIERISWKQVWDNFNGTCPICSKKLILGVHTYHFDHKVALSQGGAHATANIQVAHAQCNLRKNRY